MSTRTTPLTDALYEYMLANSLRESDVLRRLREETAQLPESQMQVSPEQGQFMALLVKLMEARRTLEIGVFTGYSSLAVALALPDDGLITACDVSETYTRVARRYWRDAGVSQKIDLRIGAAVDTLDDLIADGKSGSYDFAFVDADKEQYDAYYERCLLLLRRGGLLVFDNVFRGGKVAEDSQPDAATVAMRALNEKLVHDPRIHVSMLPVADGLTLALKA